MKEIFIIVIVFIIVCIASVIIGWLAGYDFDTRNGVVAMWAFFTIYIAGMASSLAAIIQYRM